MSEPTTPAPQSIQINLREMGLKYLGASQRTFDLTACTIGALRCETERDYDEFARSVRFMPSQQHHLAFDAIRPAAESWLLRQLLSEALSLLVPLLEDARSVAALAAWKAEGGIDQTRLQRILQEDRQAFLRLSLDDKLKHVKEKFALSAPNESFLNGYLKLGQALVRGGAVIEADATDDGALVVRLAAVDLQPASGEGVAAGAMTGRLVEMQKRFAVGDKLEFRKEEVLSLFASISLFITGIMGSLQAFVQKTLPNEAQPMT
jgi:hypothetical protein